MLPENYITLGLALCALPAFIGILSFAINGKEKPSLYLLLTSAFLLRLFMISIDPYLQDWDERFHALVAKNMIEYPFKPMLRVHPIMHYEYTSWCCNHIIAFGVVQVLYAIQKFIENDRYKKVYPVILAFILTGILIYSLKPWNISKHRSDSNTMRNIEINNAEIYKSLSEDITSHYAVLNCKSFEDTELMFYQNVNAFHWYPEERILDSLQLLGYKFAAFKSHNDQQLPSYITSDSNILIINKELK